MSTKSYYLVLPRSNLLIITPSPPSKIVSLLTFVYNKIFFDIRFENVLSGKQWPITGVKLMPFTDINIDSNAITKCYFSSDLNALMPFINFASLLGLNYSISSSIIATLRQLCRSFRLSDKDSEEELFE